MTELRAGRQVALRDVVLKVGHPSIGVEALVGHPSTALGLWLDIHRCIGVEAFLEEKVVQL